jgi:DNA helicase-2/ATP-dependent DNA helicase PcrA
MTFDDQIYRGVEVLLASPKARIRYQQQYDVVLVDEFQDLTPVQFLFVRLLALPFNNLFAVGDDDQMINSYAGADPRNLRDFTELFNGAVVHTLGENHRCAPTIVRRSANLISYNQDRFQKDIRPATRDGREKPECADSFVVRVAPNPAGEAQDIVEAIQRWRADGIAYGDTAVLVRVKNVAPLVQIALKRAGVPFVPLEKAAFFTSRVGRLVGAYMNLCRCPAVVAPEHLELALGTPPRFIAHETLVRMCADGWGCLAGHRLTPSNAQSGLKQFVANAQRVFDYSADGAKSSSEVLALVMRAFGLDEHFRKEDRNNSNTGVSGSGEMLALIRQLAAEHPRFEEFVDWYNEQSKREVEASRPGARSPKEDAVRILTIHSCKGAEFRAVALFHMSEGVAPHAKALATGMLAPIEEERRVFYVGVTRGIDRLLVTSDRSRPSRFLEELERPRPMPQPVSTAFQTGGSKPAGSTESATSAPDATDAKPQTLLGAVWRFLCDLFGGN